ncbi:uncharacterized protein LOC114526573 [Dendronephthya gigantea]|uniref:uncharacterized protein LOC114526573 n=1 Tax=Dendronephthya gigantea TaxID=151771 RepID=UPI00106CF9B0|nr:uncharacterized protein LOC114526573 [Dendronephthya gigantea]
MEKVDEYSRISSERFLLFGPANCPSCEKVDSLTYHAKKETITVVNTNGRFDFNKYTTKCVNCSLVCEPLSNLQLILQNGYWPGSVGSSLSYIFDQDLFRLWDIFQKRMPGTSQKSFLEGLEEFSLSKGRSGIINPTIFSIAFKEWKYCQFEIESLKGMNWMECPCCEKEQHSCHVDGNMKLYRYKHSGLSRSQCYYGNVFIADNDDVKKHLQQLYQGDLVIWGGRWQQGAACATGEEVEQINSYFSRLGNTTKYMLPEGEHMVMDV